MRFVYIHIGQAEKYVCMAMVGIELMTFGIQISKFKFQTVKTETRAGNWRQRDEVLSNDWKVNVIDTWLFHDINGTSNFALIYLLRNKQPPTHALALEKELWYDFVKDIN